MSLKINRITTGFTIAELLIALAIMSVLLVAVAVVLNASVINYRENEDIFKSINLARQTLFRITTQLRTASAVDPAAPENECTLITAASEDITYRYVDTENKLYLITNDDLSDTDYLLCDNVTAMTFTKYTGTHDGTTFVKSVQISITVQSGDSERTVSSAVVIRRNLE